MPRLNVIVLEQTSPSEYRYALWADVPAARQSFYANASLKSAWLGATAQDNTNLQTGAVTETISTLRVPGGTTLAQVEAFLQTQWTNFSAAIAAANPWLHYGSTWDGTTWTVTTGA